MSAGINFLYIGLVNFRSFQIFAFVEHSVMKHSVFIGRYWSNKITAEQKKYRCKKETRKINHFTTFVFVWVYFMHWNTFSAGRLNFELVIWQLAIESDSMQRRQGLRCRCWERFCWKCNSPDAERDFRMYLSTFLLCLHFCQQVSHDCYWQHRQIVAKANLTCAKQTLPASIKMR